MFATLVAFSCSFLACLLSLPVNFWHLLQLFLLEELLCSQRLLVSGTSTTSNRILAAT